MLLHWGKSIEILSNSNDPHFSINRFLYPNHMINPMPTVKQWDDIRSLFNLIVTMDDLISTPALLQHSDFLFLPEWPLDSKVYQAIVEASEASGTRLVTSVLLGSFEEKVFQALQ